MHQSLQDQLKQLQSNLSSQNSEWAQLKETLETLDPRSVLSVQREWLQTFDAVTEPEPPRASVPLGALRV